MTANAVGRNVMPIILAGQANVNRSRQTAFTEAPACDQISPFPASPHSVKISFIGRPSLNIVTESVS